MHDQCPEVADTAREVFNACFPHAERNAMKKQLVIWCIQFGVYETIWQKWVLLQKMLLEQLKELTDHGFVEKKSYEGYPLRVEYSLTDDMGMKILKALRIMQHIGIDYLKANGMEHILEEKGVVPD